MVIVGVALLIAIAIFVLQNRDLIAIRFLGWQYSVESGLALLGAALVGAIIIYFSGLIKQGQLRAQVRAAEARARELERQRPTPSDEGQQTARQ